MSVHIVTGECILRTTTSHARQSRDFGSCDLTILGSCNETQNKEVSRTACPFLYTSHVVRFADKI